MSIWGPTTKCTTHRGAVPLVVCRSIHTWTQPPPPPPWLMLHRVIEFIPPAWLVALIARIHGLKIFVELAHLWMLFGLHAIAYNFFFSRSVMIHRSVHLLLVPLVPSKKIFFQEACMNYWCTNACMRNHMKKWTWNKIVLQQVLWMSRCCNKSLGHF